MIFKKRLLLIKRYLTYAIKRLGITKTARCNIKLINQNIDILRDFKKSILQMAAFINFPISDFIYSYKNKTVKILRVLDINLSENDPIIICAVKGDLLKVKKQIEHHRKIGIKHFVYIDNMSTDGTLEWLKDQDDVSLFTVDENFNSTIKNSWRRQAMDIFGYNRWYLILDSDELFIYPGVENYPINDYIAFLEKEDIKCVHSPMIDMYANEKLFNGNTDNDFYIEEYCYFDPDSYEMAKKFWGYSILGGPQSRLFEEKNKKMMPLLTKYSLIKANKSDLIGTHNNYPFTLNFSSKYAASFLLHYKFLPNDKLKFQEIIKHGNYSRGSKKHKLFMKTYEQNHDLSFFYEKSLKLESSMDLLKLDIADQKLFRKFLND
ncbi:MAG: glycosyltransferase family 2 protein [Lachnospiraceae bacterium]|nr:glycosyltransferase family 2 protein [Lachnospiraceae bacterium]